MSQGTENFGVAIIHYRRIKEMIGVNLIWDKGYSDIFPWLFVSYSKQITGKTTTIRSQSRPSNSFPTK
jgi:hypothetical protein